MKDVAKLIFNLDRELRRLVFCDFITYYRATAKNMKNRSIEEN